MDSFSKSLEAILYIAANAPNPDIFWICKVLYHADKEHLAEYGRLITDDRYIAMEHGPVPSQMYDIYKDVKYTRTDSIGLAASEAAIRVEGDKVVPLRDADTRYMSKSDLTCIDAAIQKVGEMSFGDLSDLSHDAAWKSTRTNSTMSLDEIARMLDETETLARHLFERPRSS